MDLAQLRAFVAVVDEGGVTRAAQRLNLSQPALSRQIKTLEADLGVALFSRELRQLVMTSAGEDLLHRARALICDAATLIERARTLQSGRSGVLRLGATPPMIEALLAPFLEGWRVRHPAVELHLSEDGGASLAERLDRGDVHLAYVPAGDRRFDGELLFPIHVVAAMRKGHQLAKARTVEVTALDGQALLALRSGFGSRLWFDEACRAVGAHPRFVLESASHGVVLALAAADYGIGILPSAVLPSPERIVLRPVVLDGQPVGRWTMLAWSRRRTLPAFARAFVDEFRLFAQANYPGRALLRKAPTIPKPSD